MHATLSIELKYLGFFAENFIIHLGYRMWAMKRQMMYNLHTQKIFVHNANYDGKTQLNLICTGLSR